MRCAMNRGFTLLETLLAASLGALLVLMVVGLFGFMDRAEARQVQKLEQIDSLARIHTIMQRTFSALVVSDQMGSQTPAALPDDATGGGGRRPPQEARLLIEKDESTSLSAAQRRFKAGGVVQRLEVVLDREPVPRRFAQGLSGSLSSSVQANQDDAEQMIGGQVRGVFELRPDRATRRMDGTKVDVLTNTSGEEGWTLWWRPIGIVDESGVTEAGVDPYAVDPTEDPAAVPIAAGLKSCNWKAFVKRERQAEVRVVSYVDLPAYMEMEVQTVSGFYANWMFEVQWSIAQENALEAQKKRNQETNGRNRVIGVKKEGGK